VAYEEVSFEQLEDLVANRRWAELRTSLDRLDPADLADFLEGIEGDDRDAVFEMLDLPTASDVLVELRPTYVGEMIEEMPSDRIADLAGQMAPDEAARFLGELEPEVRSETLEAMDPERRSGVDQLLEYVEDSAGFMMNPEMCAMPDHTTRAEAKAALARSELSDPVLYIYVVDNEGRLLGLVALPQLLAGDDNEPLIDMALRDFVAVEPHEDREEVARKFRKYDLWVMPVVNENNRLVGRITVDDVIDVLHEEADEDLALMVGAPDIEAGTVSALSSARMRLPWLMITMVAGMVIGAIIRGMLKLNSIEAIAVFVPAVLAMGGNTGMQSSAIAVRGIALGEKKYTRLLGIVAREIQVGLSLGLVCGITSGLLVTGMLSWLGTGHPDLAPARLGVTVGTAMAVSMGFASAYGSMVPVILHRLKIDPAVASGPFVTTSNDLSAALIYLGVTWVLL